MFANPVGNQRRLSQPSSLRTHNSALLGCHVSQQVFLVHWDLVEQATFLRKLLVAGMERHLQQAVVVLD